MAEDNIDVELFIDEIRNYPQIWDTASESYHDRIKKRNAWISVCEKFCEGFSEKDDKEKEDIYNKFMKKWRNIKDSFSKSLRKKTKSGQAAEQGRRYIYARQLSFLEKAAATTETQSSIEEERVDDPDQSLEVSETTEENPECSRPARYEQPPKKRKRDLESALIKFMDTPMPINTTEVNPDKSFFDSLLPSISTFTEDDKLEFRCEVLNIIKRIRQSRQNTTTVGYIPHQQSVSMTSQNISIRRSTPSASTFVPQTFTELETRPLSAPSVMPQFRQSFQCVSSPSPSSSDYFRYEEDDSTVYQQGQN